MPEQKSIEIGWPLQGVNRSGAYEDQPPNTCLDAENVRPEGEFENRDRGGSRPLLVNKFRGLGDKTECSNSVAGAPSFSDGFSTVTADSVAVTNVNVSLHQSGDRTRITSAGTEFLANQVGRMLKDTSLSRSHRIQLRLSTSVIYVEGDASDFAGACTIEPFNESMVGAWITFPSLNSFQITGFTNGTTVTVRGGASNEATGTLLISDEAVSMMGEVSRSLDIGPENPFFIRTDSFRSYPEGFMAVNLGWTRSNWYNASATKSFLIQGLPRGAIYIHRDFNTADSMGMFWGIPEPALDITEKQYVWLRLSRGIVLSTETDLSVSIQLRMADIAGDVDAFQDGFVATLLWDSSTALLKITFNQFIGGSPSTPGVSPDLIPFERGITEFLDVVVSLKGDDKTLELNMGFGNVVFTHTFASACGTGAGTRIGILADNFGAGDFPGTDWDGAACGFFRVEHGWIGQRPPSAGDARQQLIVLAGGNFFTNAKNEKEMVQHGTSLTGGSDRLILSAEHLQKLYIADHGTALAIGSTLTSRGDISNANPSILTHAKYNQANKDDGDPNWFELGANTDDYVCHVTAGATGVTLGTYPLTTIATDGESVTLGNNGKGVRCNSSGSSTLKLSYHITRGLKVYDPREDTFALLSDTVGQILPTQCSIVVMFQDRVFWAGNLLFPQEWYASARSDGTDYDAADDPVNTDKATSGQIGSVGTIGDDITALIVASSDYLIFGGRKSLWVMRGDPVRGGAFDNLSRTIGVVSRKSWCVTPEGHVVFLSPAGLYVVNPASDASPVSISRDMLPAELVGVNPLETECLMEYDIEFRGIHIYLSPRYDVRKDFVESDVFKARHWWFSWKHKSYWPIVIPAQLQPLSIISYSASSSGTPEVLLGGRKGQITHYQRGDFSVETSLDSYIIFGPFDLYADGHEKILASIEAELVEESADMTWEIFVDKTPALAATKALDSTSTPDATGTWSSGLSYRSHPRVSGGGMCIKVKKADSSSSASPSWAMEKIVATFVQGGRRRK